MPFDRYTVRPNRVSGCWVIRETMLGKDEAVAWRVRVQIGWSKACWKALAKAFRTSVKASKSSGWIVRYKRVKRRWHSFLVVWAPRLITCEVQWIDRQGKDTIKLQSCWWVYCIYLSCIYNIPAELLMTVLYEVHSTVSLPLWGSDYISMKTPVQIIKKSLKV